MSVNSGNDSSLFTGLSQNVLLLSKQIVDKNRRSEEYPGSLGLPFWRHVLLSVLAP